MKIFSSCALVFSLCALFASSFLAQDDHFDIVRFQIEGNTLLPHPPPGINRACSDPQKALEAAEGADRKPDCSTWQVYVPWQELISGVIEKTVSVPGLSQRARFRASGLDLAPFNLAFQFFTRV